MQVEPVERVASYLTVEWDDGARAPFHYVWLRDNCACPDCRHPDAWERTFDPLTMPLDLAPATVAGGEALQVTWPDGHRTRFSAGWLRRHAYAPGLRRARADAITPWDRQTIMADLPEVDHAAVMAGDEGVRHWLRLIRRYGFALVRNVPTRPGAVVALAERIAFVQETNFGRVFEVVSKPDPEHLAYTAVKLNAHTDVVNRRSLPGLQLLHCLEFQADGGESILIDGYAAARRLRAERPEDHEVLTAVSVPYHFQDDATDIRNWSPVIGVDRDGNYTEIRYHNALLAPLDLDPELVVPFYRAYQSFGRILRDPAQEFQFKMQPGDCQVFDNRRVLHARAAFDPGTGPRHLQGCYVDRDDFVSRLEVLERNGTDFRQS